jgi:hypothetical protein
MLTNFGIGTLEGRGLHVANKLPRHVADAN